MSWVLVLDTEHRPLDPVHPGAARRLLARRQAAVWRRAPFTRILQHTVPAAAALPPPQPPPLRLTRDPGSRTTGPALLTEPATAAQAPATAAQGPAPATVAPAPSAAARAAASAGRVVWAGELTHRGGAVHRTTWHRTRRGLPKTHGQDGGRRGGVDAGAAGGGGRLSAADHRSRPRHPPAVWHGPLWLPDAPSHAPHARLRRADGGSGAGGGAGRAGEGGHACGAGAGAGVGPR